MNIEEKFEILRKKNYALTVYAAERWGTPPCPIRFAANPYYNCSFRCNYCYVWKNKDLVKPRTGFIKALKKDIALVVELGLNKYVVEVSPSTDPFQPIELKERLTLKTINLLLENDFKVLIVTKNPRMLLDSKYKSILENKNVTVDVTITSMREKSSNILSNTGPSPTEKFNAIRELIARGMSVRVRIDPLIPPLHGMEVQSTKDIADIVEQCKLSGVKIIISKTLRLSKEMPLDILKKFMPYYRQHGERHVDTMILNGKTIEKIMTPLIIETTKKGIKLCTCCDEPHMKRNENYISCRVIEESRDFIKGISTGD